MNARTAASTRRRRRTQRGRRRSVRRRRQRLRVFGVTAGIVVVCLALSAVIAAGVVAVRAFSEPLGDIRLGVEPAASPPPPGLGYGPEQLANACTILTAGRDLGFGARDQTIAVMTAMGESSLRNLDYGDWETNGVTNPDGSRTTSLGLFQQQENWGTLEERMDPYTSAVLFYRAMERRVPDRDTIDPTLVAHRVQINADPQHYARYWDRATRVVDALTGTPGATALPDGAVACVAP
ncbi:peptidase M23 [Microbacterium sp. 18062]|uniref:peptidase M23 n=1 Tax=Microbacterium sp. 18062 TaxID=2681410 RepID=UPI001F30E746|nr:peptidase M23 [Microbacterium sp. 18062]